MKTLSCTGLSTIDFEAADWMSLIRSEYAEMPGLSLTRRQVERLWNLSPDTADMLLWELQSRRYLRRTTKGTYVRADLTRA